MLKLLAYLISKGVVTSGRVCPPLDEGARGLPRLTDRACSGAECYSCVSACPTNAIKVLDIDGSGAVTLDLGMCIACGLCVDLCPTGTIANDLTTRVATDSREDLLLTNSGGLGTGEGASKPEEQATGRAAFNPFARSVAARVVSTGCTACDLEIGAAVNPIFDMERFGVHVVASPRFADVLLVTGPVPRGMQTALASCYQAMSRPRKVIAVGSCAVSGGLHRGGYAEANGIGELLPIDVFIPGCPPHPWSVIHGVRVAMGQDEPRRARKGGDPPELSGAKE